MKFNIRERFALPPESGMSFGSLYNLLPSLFVTELVSYFLLERGYCRP